MPRYEDLLVWNKAHQLTLDVYKITTKFPKEELFGIISQIRRACSSVPANIAEGQSRWHKKEFIQFLFVARGSLNETHYYFRLSYDLGYLTESELNNLINQSEEVMKLLNSLINSLKSPSK